MKDDQHITRLPRRHFLERGGLALLGSAAMASRSAFAAAGATPNPFAYDVSRFTITDPALLRYEEVRRFRSEDPAPNRITVGHQNQVLIAGAKGVRIYSASGERVLEAPLPEAARCAAQDQTGKIVVGLRDHIEVLDEKGRVLHRWAAPAARAWITGIAVTDDSVYAADSGNRVVWRFDKAGKVLREIGRKDKDRNIPGLVLPSPYLDVAMGPDGLLRINNPGRHLVEIYTPDGDLELRWGKPSAGISGFCGCCNPIGISMLPDGRHVTCEKGLPRVKIYSTKGEFECVVAGPEMFPGNAEKGALLNKSEGRFGGMDAAAGADGRVHILDLVSGEVIVMRQKA